MTTIKSLPYLTPMPTHIQVDDWHRVTSLEGMYPLGKTFPEWDPAVSVQAETRVTINVPAVFKDCRLNSDAVLRIAAIWESAGSGLKGKGSHQNIHYSSDSQVIQLSVDASGVQLAKEVELQALLILLEPGSNPQTFAPRLPGSTLFKDAYTVQLEGDGARFPTEVIDFTETQYPTNAGWALEWNSTELDYSVLGDLRLYINARHHRVMQAVSSTSEDGFDIREAIRFDIARSLIYGALQNPQFVENPEQYEDGSVGAAVHNLLRAYFPQYTTKDLQAQINQPQTFEPRLQEKLRVFWSEAL
ncbi:MAG: hypothetical protein OHK0046_36880 [Anaerolineae bacterium]